MEPFVHLPAFGFVACTTCRYACIADEVATHLRHHHSESMNVDRRKVVVEAVAKIPDIIRNQEELRNFRYPPPTTEPIPFIAPPRADGIRCNECGFVIRTVQGIQAHCRKEHGWQNEWTKGGNIKQKAQQPRQVPWTTGIRCQRFFKSRSASSYFEVRQCDGAPDRADDPAALLAERLLQSHAQQAAVFSDTTSNLSIGLHDEKAEPNLWLRRVGWDEHLQGLDAKRLRATLSPTPHDNPVLFTVWSSLDRVLDQAQQSATTSIAGHAALFEIERKTPNVKPKRPFDSRLEPDTWARYKAVMCKLLNCLLCVDAWDVRDRPPYRLSNRQAELLRRLRDEAGKDALICRLTNLTLDVTISEPRVSVLAY